ncbi:hypothetical protein MNBD_ALPHA09-1576 [hydrothermal vent metagenome]|uniref:Uncharacterized protein n=1 Tax=hydrothermal vent metagenome TaxID=652676 RepID=A0A3B0TRJ9_9ZZZZ
MDATYNLNGGFKPTAKRNADISGPDFFPTPAWATYALIDNERFEGDIWECACGDGAMSEVLAQSGNRVDSSDLYERGFGESGRDFLTDRRRAANIVTNPPYNCAQGFVEAAARKAEKKFALLLRLAFLEGANRANTIFSNVPPSRVWVFSERITFYPKNAERAGSGTTAYAWFVWDKSHVGKTELSWFKPGYKKMYA